MQAQRHRRGARALVRGAVRTIWMLGAWRSVLDPYGVHGPLIGGAQQHGHAAEPPQQPHPLRRVLPPSLAGNRKVERTAEPGPLLAGEPAEGHVDAKEDGYYDGSEEREHVSSAVGRARSGGATIYGGGQNRSDTYKLSNTFNTDCHLATESRKIGT